MRSPQILSCSPKFLEKDVYDGIEHENILCNQHLLAHLRANYSDTGDSRYAYLVQLASSLPYSLRCGKGHCVEGSFPTPYISYQFGDTKLLHSCPQTVNTLILPSRTFEVEVGHLSVYDDVDYCSLSPDTPVEDQESPGPLPVRDDAWSTLWKDLERRRLLVMTNWYAHAGMEPYLNNGSLFLFGQSVSGAEGTVLSEATLLSLAPEDVLTEADQNPVCPGVPSLGTRESRSCHWP